MKYQVFTFDMLVVGSVMKCVLTTCTGGAHCKQFVLSYTVEATKLYILAMAHENRDAKVLTVPSQVLLQT